MRALRTQLAAHRPGDAEEAADLARVVTLLGWLRAPLDQHADPTHVTGSAIVLAPDRRVLLHRHKRLQRWLQPGGHVDAGESPWEAAVRETREETGLDAPHPHGGPVLVHVDVHEGPRGHLHLDLRYLLLGDPEVALRPAPGESQAVAWWPAAEVAAVSDRSTVRAVCAALRLRTDAGGAPPRP